MRNHVAAAVVHRIVPRRHWSVCDGVVRASGGFIGGGSVSHTDHVAPGNVVEKLPAEFVCFSDHWRFPRKYCKSEGDSYDVFVWSEGRWQFHDNVGEDTAKKWYRNESETYVR